jgi:hypothetical protein
MIVFGLGAVFAMFSGVLDPWILPSYVSPSAQAAPYDLPLDIPDEPKIKVTVRPEPEAAEMCPPESRLEEQWITFTDDTPLFPEVVLTRKPDGSLWRVENGVEKRLYEKSNCEYLEPYIPVFIDSFYVSWNADTNESKGE